MEPANYPTDDQQPSAVVQCLLQQLRHRDPVVHGAGAASNGPADREAGQADEGHEPASTANEAGSGEVQGRPGAGIAGDDAPLQRARGQPAGLPGPDGDTVPHLDRAVPDNQADRGVDAGEPGGVVPTLVLLAARGPQRHPDRRLVLVDGPGAARSVADGDAGPGRRFDVGHAEDDHDAIGGCASGIDEPHDALDDAADVRVLHPELLQRLGALLGIVEHNRCGDSGVHNGMGPAEVLACFWARQRTGGDNTHRRVTGAYCRGDGKRCAR